MLSSFISGWILWWWTPPLGPSTTKALTWSSYRYGVSIMSHKLSASWWCMYSQTGLELASRAVYSLHKTSTRDHVLSKAKEWGAEGRYVWSAFLKNANFCVFNHDVNLLQGPCRAEIWPSCNLQAPQESFCWHSSWLYQIHPTPNFLAKPVTFFLNFLFVATCNVPAAAKKRFSHFRFCLLSDLIISKISSRWAGRATLMTRLIFVL